MSLRSTMYKLLAVCLRIPEASWVEGIRQIDPFKKILQSVSLEELQREHTRLFSLTVAGGVPPYETEYGHKDVFFKTQRLADIAGFYRAFGFEVSDLAHERVDFIGAELELMFWLTLKEETASQKGRQADANICKEAATKFMTDHLGRWGSFFGDSLVRDSHPFYRYLGEQLTQWVESECRRLGAEPERVTGWEPPPVTASFECGLDGKECAS